MAQATTNTLLHAEALVLPRTGVINYKLIWLLKMLAIGRMTLESSRLLCRVQKRPIGFPKKRLYFPPFFTIGISGHVTPAPAVSQQELALSY